MGDSKKALNIVYDVDDVLNNLMDYLVDKLNIPPPSLFEIDKCKEYTETQKKSILNAFKDPEVFKNLSYVPGAREICNIEETGKALVWINSASFSEELIEIKRNSLLSDIPNLTPSRVIITLSLGENKGILENTDVIVEDRLLNLLKYRPRVKKILINKTSNQAASYNISDEDYGIIRVGSLVEANEYIRQLVERY